MTIKDNLSIPLLRTDDSLLDDSDDGAMRFKFKRLFDKKSDDRMKTNTSTNKYKRLRNESDCIDSHLSKSKNGIIAKHQNNKEYNNNDHGMHKLDKTLLENDENMSTTSTTSTTTTSTSTSMSINSNSSSSSSITTTSTTMDYEIRYTKDGYEIKLIAAKLSPPPNLEIETNYLQYITTSMINNKQKGYPPKRERHDCFKDEWLDSLFFDRQTSLSTRQEKHMIHKGSKNNINNNYTKQSNNTHYVIVMDTTIL